MRTEVGAVAVALVAAAYFVPLLPYGINLEDEGLILHQISRAATGERPYLDFHTGYTPGTFWVNAALLWWVSDSVIPIRGFLVLVNAAAVAMIFVLTRPVAGSALAAVAALGWAAFLPAFVGEFASFNVPYPSWYAGLLFLLVHWATNRFAARGDREWLWVAGAAAGLAFTFKPNTGVLGALAVGVVLAVLHAGERDPDRGAARGMLVAATLVILAAFGFRLWMPEVWLVAGPILLLIALRAFWGQGRVVTSEGFWACVWTTAGAGLIVTAPWVAWFVAKLGLGGFVREVLLLGSNADIIYATPYPIPLGFPGSWPALAALGLLAVAALGEGVVRGRVRRVTALAVLIVGGVGGAGFLWQRAAIPEGLWRSITWQVQHVGFYAVPFMLMAVAAGLMRRLRLGRHGLDPEQRSLLVATVFASSLYVTLYPRIDTMHLIVAMPSALVVAGAVTRRLATVWGSVLGVGRRPLRAGMVVGAATLALIAAVPNWAGVARARTTGWVTLASPRVPVRLERDRAADFAALNGVLGYLGERAELGDRVFTFPATALVPFALAHPTPTPHDYYFPGRPDHHDEAEIVRALRRTPPPWVVTLNRRLGFFSESPAYYFLLREFLRDRYQLAARFGRYDVLVPAEDAPPVPTALDYVPDPVGTLFERLSDSDREQRRAAIETVLQEAAAGGARLDDYAATESERLLVLRNIAEVSDARGLEIAWEAYGPSSRRVSNEAAGVLNFLALRDILGRHVIATDVAAAARMVPPGLVELDLEKLRYMLLDQDLRLQVGVFAAWALEKLGDAGAEEAFDRVLAEETKRPLFQVMAARGLTLLGRERGPCALVDLLALRKHETQNTVPSFLMAAATASPALVTPCLERGLRHDVPLAREGSVWVAGRVGLGALAPVLRELVAADPDADVVAAAAWALGRIEDPDAVAVLRVRAGDDDERVAGFATEALRRIEGRTS